MYKNLSIFYQDYKMLRKKQGVGTIRYVTVMKGENEGLGISITVSCLNIFQTVKFVTVLISIKILKIAM